MHSWPYLPLLLPTPPLPFGVLRFRRNLPSERARLVFADPHFEHVHTVSLFQWDPLARGFVLDVTVLFVEHDLAALANNLGHTKKCFVDLRDLGCEEVFQTTVSVRSEGLFT